MILRSRCRIQQPAPIAKRHRSLFRASNSQLKVTETLGLPSSEDRGGGRVSDPAGVRSGGTPGQFGQGI